MEEKLNQIFQSVFKTPGLAVRRDMAAKDVEGWDSITHAEMIAAVEAGFGVKFKLREITKWKNVGDMMDMLAEKGVGR